MGKMVETTIKDFTQGISDDPRTGNQIITNFNVLSNSRRLIPYHESETGDDAPTTSLKKNFCIAHHLPGSTNKWRLFALGVVSGTGFAEILYKDLTTGAAQDLDDSDWDTTAPANNQSASGATNFNLFVYYKKTGKIYGAKAGTSIWAFDVGAGGAFTEADASISYTNVAQGLVHSKDDVLYVPYDNKIAKNDNGSWTTAALTLPTHYVITSICEYGDYLAIACAHLSGVGNSRVFLWDRDSSLTTISASIDWGEGALMVLDQVDGVLIGISQVGGTGSTFSGIPNGSANFADRVVFRQLSGTVAYKFKEYITSSTSTALPIAKQVVDNRLYFMMQTTLNGAVREGVWSVGRVPGEPFTVIHERTPNNDTALTGSKTLYNFIKVGSYIFQSYLDNGTHAVSKTKTSGTYTATSIVETKIIDDDAPTHTKKLHGVSVLTEYLPSAGQVVLKYRKDEETSFTTILTKTTDGTIVSDAVNIESSGAELPTYKEITFRIESTGGAVPTGLSWQSEIITDRLY